MLILGLETSGKTASAALYEDGTMLGQTSIYTVKTQSQVILPTVKRLMSDCGRELSALTAIAVSKGPGSYTGIRIGIAAVKAMSFALGIPCFGISSLLGMSFGCGAKGYVCSVMSARKDLVYSAVYYMENGGHREIMSERLISEAELEQKLMDIDGSVTLTGDGAKKIFEHLMTENVDKFTLSPVHLRLQNASGVILAALKSEPSDHMTLNASYLQLVKAEKDLIEKNNAATG